MKVNINDRIKVKLTINGKKIHFDHCYNILHGHLRDTSTLDVCLPEQDSKGYTTYTIWEFAHIFGEHLYHGSEPIINENEIIILPEQEYNDHDRMVTWLGKFCKHIDNDGKVLCDEENIAFFREKLKHQFGWEDI